MALVVGLQLALFLLHVLALGAMVLLVFSHFATMALMGDSWAGSAGIGRPSQHAARQARRRAGKRAKRARGRTR